MEKGLMETNIVEYPLFARGKVRDVYDLNDKLLIIATDRISAFDVVLPTGIPGKGKILNQMSLFWFNLTKDIVDNHLISAEVYDYPEKLHNYRDMLDKRSMLVKKANRIDIECVVRGFISGSFWKEYQQKRIWERKAESITLHGISLPPDLVESDRLPYPIFTPATKAEEGHDQNISLEKMAKMVGEELASNLRSLSIRLYQKASDYAFTRGIIMADTKFEFGILNDRVILIDEIFSPDSSRFWSKENYKPGRAQDSFDKQFVRDYLESISWDKKPPAPELPDDIVEKTLKKYESALEKLTGEHLT